MFNINISNHPASNNITRTVSVKEITFVEDKKLIKLGCNVRHYMNEVEWFDMNKRIELVLDNTKQYPIDAEGHTIGDFDAFLLQAEMSQQFSVMVTQGILAVDVDGTINAKCGYRVDIQPITVTSEVVNESAIETADGSITLTVSGGITPYSFAWNTGETSKDLIGLSAGTYICTVSDATNYTTDVEVSISVDVPEIEE